MGRITWIDSSRGLAILCLIVIHYIGALESRGYITYDILNIIKSLFRVATPYFILIFGFTFSIINSNKLTDMHGVERLYKKLFFRLMLVLLARQIIVIISSIRYPELKPYLWDILSYSQTSRSGEILTFYFIAIAIAPISLYFMRSTSKKSNVLTIILIYSISYYIGSTYSQFYNNILFRILFYDVYAFFPFFSLVMFGMFLGLVYKEIGSDVSKFKLFFLLGLFFIGLGSISIYFITPTPIETLALAKLKSPPHIVYILIYLGVSIIITILLAIYSNNKYCPKLPLKLLDVLGRNSLLSYVLHYFLFIASPISVYIFGFKNRNYELAVFISILLLMFIVIYCRDYYKNYNLNKRWCKQ